MTPRRQQLRHWAALVLGRATPDTHHQRRYTRLLQAIITALFGKGLAAFVSLVTVPLTISYLGAERYGLWVTISTLLIWFQLADIGLGNGLTNALSEAYGAERPDTAQRATATVFWALSAIALALCLAGFAAGRMVDWSSLFRVSDPLAQRELNSALAAALLITCLGIPLNIVEKVYAAYQESATANVWAAIGSLASLAALLLVIWLHGGLVALVWAFSGALLLVRALSALWLFTVQKPWLAPALSSFDRGQLRRLTGVGLEFLFIQIAALVLYQSQSLIIAYFLGPADVAEYNVVYRLFAYITMLQSLMLAPLWPAFAEASARSDWPWIRTTLRRTLLSNLGLFGLAVIVLGLFGRQAAVFWTGGAVVPVYGLVIISAVWSLMTVWGNCFGVFLNGMGVLREQVVVAMLMAGLSLGLSIYWVQLYGVTGIPLATSVAYAATTLWIAPVLGYRKLHRCELGI
jgi:O-antigen/teichoic acid export membrane protein